MWREKIAFQRLRGALLIVHIRIMKAGGHLPQPKFNGFGRKTCETHSFGHGYKSYNSSDHRFGHSAQTRKAGSFLMTATAKEQPKGKGGDVRFGANISGDNRRPHRIRKYTKPSPSPIHLKGKQFRTWRARYLVSWADLLRDHRCQR